MTSNCFDPRRRRLFLTRETAGGATLAAWAVALHEAGHAAQTGEALGDVKWRQT
ncbi:MAG TPA: peptidase, partial [Verrucomicrobiales bacterium]|nr:peptidase [Verrucomicrobiales bacterium]